MLIVVVRTFVVFFFNIVCVVLSLVVQLSLTGLLQKERLQRSEKLVVEDLASLEDYNEQVGGRGRLLTKALACLNEHKNLTLIPIIVTNIIIDCCTNNFFLQLI